MYNDKIVKFCLSNKNCNTGRMISTIKSVTNNWITNTIQNINDMISINDVVVEDHYFFKKKNNHEYVQTLDGQQVFLFRKYEKLLTIPESRPSQING